MLTLYRLIKNSSNYSQVLFVQLLIYLTVISAVIYTFDLKLLLTGLVIGWLLFCVGVSAGLHKWISHRTFVPRNKFIKWLLLWAGVQSTLGSPIGFAAGHRQHHSDSDGSKDPFVLTDSTWNNIKLWFYHFDTSNISPRLIKDLTQDQDIKFVHTHYWKIWCIYPGLLLLINPVLFVYLFAVPAVWVFLGMSYVTVVAHATSWKGFFCGTSNYNDLDKSWDSGFFSVLFAGEGYHHAHHVNPGLSDYSLMNGRVDPSGLVIRLFLSKQSNHPIA